MKDEIWNHWALAANQMHFCRVSLADEMEKERAMALLSLCPTRETVLPDAFTGFAKERGCTDLWQAFLFPEITGSADFESGPIPEKVRFNVEDIAKRANVFVVEDSANFQGAPGQAAQERLAWAMKRVRELNPEAEFYTAVENGGNRSPTSSDWITHYLRPIASPVDPLE